MLFAKYNDVEFRSYTRPRFERMVAAELAPPWAMNNILLTGDTKRLTPFYKRVLGLG